MPAPPILATPSSRRLAKRRATGVYSGSFPATGLSPAATRLARDDVHVCRIAQRCAHARDRTLSVGGSAAVRVGVLPQFSGLDNPRHTPAAAWAEAAAQPASRPASAAWRVDDGVDAVLLHSAFNVSIGPGDGTVVHRTAVRDGPGDCLSWRSRALAALAKSCACGAGSRS